MSLEECQLQKVALAQFNVQHHSVFTHLKPKQLESLRKAKVSDTIIVLPTGYGKSVIFELLPFFSKYVWCLKCIVILIEPLNTIIEQELSRLGPAALKIESNVAFSPEPSHMYYIGHPEDILSCADDLGRLSKKVDRTFVVVDEAHCILEWGIDFRPDFKHIAELRASICNLSMIAMTATASLSSQKEITKSLGMKNPNYIFSLPVLNDNVALHVVVRTPSTGGANTVETAHDFVYKRLILQLLREKQDFPLTIVYCKLQWCAYGTELSQRLMGDTYWVDAGKTIGKVAQYHSQQPKEVNQSIVQRLSVKDSSLRLLFPTVALGMGCDLRHVRRVVHAGPPANLEDYVQEVGRAGRDNSPAQAILYYNNSDLCQPFLDISMRQYCKLSGKCRRRFVSDYFSCSLESSGSSNCCDFCMKGSNEDKDFKVPSYHQREQVYATIIQYRQTDVTGHCQKIMTDHVIHVVSETFEYVGNIYHLIHTYGIPKTIAEALFVIISNVMSDN